MDHQQQPLAAIRHIHPHHTHQTPGPQLQVPLRRLRHCRHRGRIRHRHLLEQTLRHRTVLRRPAHRPFPEPQAQRIVMRHHRTHRRRHVPPLQPAPHSQQHRLVPVMTLLQNLLEKTLLDRKQRQRSCHPLFRCRRTRRGRTARRQCQLRHRLLLEDQLRRQLDPPLPQTRDHLQAQDRIPAQLEEVVAPTHPLPAQDLRPHLRQRRLHLAFRRRPDLRRHRGHGLRQRLAVHLPVRRQRQPLQHHHHRRHHVVRQRLRHRRLQGIGLQHCAMGRHAIRHQLLLVFPVRHRTGQDDRLRNPVQTLQHARDLARLDPIAPQLHLVVAPADEPDPAVLAAAHQVACPVQPSARPLERVRHEPFRRQLRTAAIPPRHPRAADIEFPHRPWRHPVQGTIQHIGARVRQGPANRDRIVQRIPGPDLMRQHPDRGLGRAVVVDDPAARPQPPDLRHQPRVTGLTPQHQRMPGQHIDRVRRPHQPAQMPGHDLEDADPAVPHQARKPVGVEHRVGRHQGQGRARGQRPEQHGVAQIRRHRRHHRHSGPGLRRQPVQQCLGVVGQRRMRHGHTLRHPRRPRGVDHIGRLRRMDHDPGRRLRQSRQGQGIV